MSPTPDQSIPPACQCLHLERNHDIINQHTGPSGTTYYVRGECLMPNCECQKFSNRTYPQDQPTERPAPYTCPTCGHSIAQHQRRPETPLHQFPCRQPACKCVMTTKDLKEANQPYKSSEDPRGSAPLHSYTTCVCGHPRLGHASWMSDNPGECWHFSHCPCRRFQPVEKPRDQDDHTGDPLDNPGFTDGTDDPFDSSTVNVELQTRVTVRFRAPIEARKLTGIINHLVYNTNLGENPTVSEVRVVKGDRPYISDHCELVIESSNP